MDKLLSSQSRHDQELISVGNLSPEKYGRSAFYNLQYTPSKLADNVLYKEVTTLKKVQQESAKNREFEAINDCLMQKLKYMEEEKNVIVTSLNQQIVVYKKIIKEMEGKNQDRIRELQKKFKEELNKIIASKEEEVKFVQSQKELLQNKIEELQKERHYMQQKIDLHDRSVSDIKSDHEKLQKQVTNLNYKIKEKAQQLKDSEQKNRIQIENLQRKLLDTQMTWKMQLREALNRKQIERQAIENSHKQSMKQYEQLRKLQSESFKKQTSDIIHSYEKELKKLTEIISNKQRTIQSLTRDHRDEKSKNFTLTKTYESELGDLTKVKLIKAELETENQKLRELLIQSSKELERCREQFLLIDQQNMTLRIKVKSSDEEAKTWRQSYYMAKRV